MEEKTKSNNYIPPIDLVKFTQALLDEEVNGNKVEAEERTGVSRGKFYYHFNKHSEFRDWYSKQCSDYLEINEAIPATRLISKIKTGDMQAIRTYYELREKLKINIKGGGLSETQIIILPPQRKKEDAVTEDTSQRLPI